MLNFNLFRRIGRLLLKKRNLSYISSPSFCVAPWVHSHIDAEGARRLCCISDSINSQFGGTDFQTYFNGSYIKGIRKKMLSGIWPSECSLCQKSNRTRTYQYDLNVKFSHHIKNILEQTQEDGTYLFSPVYLDYRTDRCNLKCRTCGPYSSTAWQTVIKKNPELDIVSPGDIERKKNIWQNRRNVEEGQFAEFEKLALNPRTEFIYFAGGEPSLSPGHFELLNKLSQSEHADGVSISINTNLALPKEKLLKWLKILSFFKYIGINVSIDGTQDLAEYVRSGLDWKMFEENLDILRSYKCNKINVFLDPTITSLFWTELREFSEFALRKNIPVVTKLMTGTGACGEHLKVEFLPLQIRRILYNDWLSFYESKSSREQSLLLNLKETLEMALDGSEYTLQERNKVLLKANRNDQILGNGKFIELMSKNSMIKEWLKSTDLEGSF